MGENMNINVNKRKKKSIIPLLFVIIIILIGIIGILVYGKTGSQDVENIPEISNPTVDIYENTITEIDNPTNNVNEKVKAVYEKYEDAVWISKNYIPKVNIFYIENGKVVCESTNSHKKEVVDLEYGKAKYVYNVLNSSMLTYIVILSEDGNVYTVDLSNAISNSNTYNINNLELNKISFGTKVVDILINAKGMFPNSSPYYLTEDGKLYNKEKKTYEEINRNHIAYYGSADNIVFINKNKTMEVLRSIVKNEYLTILDKSGNNVIAKYVFYKNSDNLNEKTESQFYVIDKDDRLLVFSNESIYVASKYNDQKVKNVNYNDSKQEIKINFEDGSSIMLKDVYQYLELK